MTPITAIGFATGLVRFYQRAIRPAIPASCRFQPTCSDYCIEAIERYGVWRGAYLALRRVGRCHPFHAPGFDPVP